MFAELLLREKITPRHFGMILSTEGETFIIVLIAFMSLRFLGQLDLYRVGSLSSDSMMLWNAKMDAM